MIYPKYTKVPAAFGRLCVETKIIPESLVGYEPAAFGRLCVETLDCGLIGFNHWPSRLRAAVC